MGGCGKQAGRPRVGRTKDQSARRRSSSHTSEHVGNYMLKTSRAKLKRLLPFYQQKNSRTCVKRPQIENKKRGDSAFPRRSVHLENASPPKKRGRCLDFCTH